MDEFMDMGFDDEEEEADHRSSSLRFDHERDSGRPLPAGPRPLPRIPKKKKGTARKILDEIFRAPIVGPLLSPLVPGAFGPAITAIEGAIDRLVVDRDKEGELEEARRYVGRPLPPRLSPPEPSAEEILREFGRPLPPRLSPPEPSPGEPSPEEPGPLAALVTKPFVTPLGVPVRRTGGAEAFAAWKLREEARRRDEARRAALAELDPEELEFLAINARAFREDYAGRHEERPGSRRELTWTPNRKRRIIPPPAPRRARPRPTFDPADYSMPLPSVLGKLGSVDR